MEENPEQNKYLTPEQYVEQLKKDRRKLRELIKKIMEEEMGIELAIEDDLSAILKTLTKEQQQSVYSKLRVAQIFPDK